MADLNPATTEVLSPQFDSDIDISSNGTVIVAWTHQFGSNHVRFRRYSTDGTPLDPADRTISLIAYYEGFPRVATGPDDSFVIGYLGGRKWIGYDAFFDIYNADGEFFQRVQVFGTEDLFQSNFDLAVSPNGNIVAVWTEREEGALNRDVRAKVFDSRGNALTNVILVTSTPGIDESFAKVAADLEGDFVVAYEQDGATVAVQRIAADGELLGAPLQPAPPVMTSGDRFVSPSVGRAHDGSYVVSYTVDPVSGADFGYWHLFNADGSQRAEGSLVRASTADMSVASIDMDMFGNFVIGSTRSTLTEGAQAEATFFDSTGREGETVSLNQNPVGDQTKPAVAIKNNLLVATYSDSANTGDVEFSAFEQRRGKLGVARANAGGGLTFFLDSNANWVFDEFDAVFDFGLAGDIVAVGDWNGDGAEDLGVGRPNAGGGLTFYLDSNGSGFFDLSDTVVNFGLAGDTIVVGDWNGDGVDNLGVSRPNGSGGLVFSLDSNGNWEFDPSDAVFNFGLAGDTVVAGDWNGDGIDNVGVARANGTGGLGFSLDSNDSGGFDGSDAVFNFGLQQDQIVVGDWDGDGVDALGVARPNGTGGKTISPDVNESYQFDLTDALFAFNFGLPDDLLFVGAWAQTPLRGA